MFSQPCVKNSVHRVGRCTTPRQTTPLGRHPHWAGRHSLDRHSLGRHPPRSDGYCSGRYASYWNAFLLQISSCQKLFEFSCPSFWNSDIAWSFQTITFLYTKVSGRVVTVMILLPPIGETWTCCYGGLIASCGQTHYVRL